MARLLAAAVLVAFACSGAVASERGLDGNSAFRNLAVEASFAVVCSDGGAAPSNTVIMRCGGATDSTTELVDVVIGGTTSGTTTLHGMNFDVTYDTMKVQFVGAATYTSPLFPDALVAVTLFNGQQGRVVVSIQNIGGATVTVPVGQSLVLSLAFRAATGTMFGPTPLLFENAEVNGASEPISFLSALKLSYLCAPVTWYADSDGDDYGNPAVAASTCDQPPGYVANNLDCNDASPAVHPGASEHCNGIDDDCNGQIDEGVSRNIYRDADDDGYGDPSVSQYTCYSPAGWVIQSGDCNDANPNIHPGAPEACNGIDDNCNGLIDDDAAEIDSDGDGIHNACDNCRFAFNPDQLESDGDGVGNSCDNCALVSNPNQADLDSDARGDICDNCPSAANSFQDDFDGDRAGDACDNCVFDFNPTQSDFDHDNQGDLCDLNDGLIYIYATDRDYREWQAESGYTTWNSYRGSLAVLRATGQYTQAPGSNPRAGRDCGLSDPYVFDSDIPAPGDMAFNLVTGMAGGIESGLGTNSAGVPRANAHPCP